MLLTILVFAIEYTNIFYCLLFLARIFVSAFGNNEFEELLGTKQFSEEIFRKSARALFPYTVGVPRMVNMLLDTMGKRFKLPDDFGASK